MRETPVVLGGLLIILGYFKAMVTGAPRYENPEFRAYLQRWQLGQLKAKLFGRSASSGR